MGIIQIVAIGLLVIYGIGALYYLYASSIFMIRRKRNLEISLLADILARLITILGITVLWPVNKYLN